MKIFRSLIPDPERDIESSCAKTRNNRGRLSLRTCVIGTRQLRHVKRSLYAKCSGSVNRILAPAHKCISQVSREEGLHDSKAQTNEGHHLFPTTHLEVPDKEPRGYGEEEICYDAENYKTSVPDFPIIFLSLPAYCTVTWRQVLNQPGSSLLGWFDPTDIRVACTAARTRNRSRRWPP